MQELYLKAKAELLLEFEINFTSPRVKTHQSVRDHSFSQRRAVSSDDNEESEGNAVLVPIVDRTPIPRFSSVAMSKDLSRLPQQF